MSRLADFRRHLSEQLSWLVRRQVVEKMMKVISYLAFLLPFAGVATIMQDWASWCQPWLGVFLVGVFVVFVTSHVAIACYKSRGPIIWVSEPKLMPQQGDLRAAIELSVKNIGNGKAVASVFVVDVRDETGTRVARTKTESFIRWRGFNPELGDAPKSLYGDKSGFITVLTLKTISDAAFRMIIGNDDPIVIQGKHRFRITLRVDFHESNGDFCKSKTMAYDFVLDPDSPDLCCLTSSA